MSVLIYFALLFDLIDIVVVLFSIFDTDSCTAGAYVSGACVSGASVSGASVSGPSVSGASVSGASVSGASVSGPSVSGASVSGASVSGASVYGASVSGVSVSGFVSSVSGSDGLDVSAEKAIETALPAISSDLIASVPAALYS